MVDKNETGDGSVEEAAPPVIPSESGNGGWEDEAHEDDQRKVKLVLELDHGVSPQIGDVSDTWLASRLDNHPSQMRPEETIVSSVRVKIGVGISVVRSVAPGPPVDGALYGTCTHKSEEVFQGTRRSVRSVRPKSVISGCDTETGEKVVDESPNECFPLELRGEHSVESKQGCRCQDRERHPLNLAEDVLPLDWRERRLSLQSAGDVVIWNGGISIFNSILLLPFVGSSLLPTRRRDCRSVPHLIIGGIRWRWRELIRGRCAESWLNRLPRGEGRCCGRHRGFGGSRRREPW